MSGQFAKAVEELWWTMFDPCRLGLNYMRGSGPKWRATQLPRNGPEKKILWSPSRYMKGSDSATWPETANLLPFLPRCGSPVAWEAHDALV